MHSGSLSLAHCAPARIMFTNIIVYELRKEKADDLYRTTQHHLHMQSYGRTDRMSYLLRHLRPVNDENT